jgi:aminopeptidase 2
MTDSSSPTEFRLPTDVRPMHYDLTIRTDLEKQTFDGFVIAQCVSRSLVDLPLADLSRSLNVHSETNKVEFHATELNLGNAIAFCDGLQTEQLDTSRAFEKEQERTILHFATAFPAGSNVQLRIAFDGVLTDSMMGYYKSKYEVDGATKYYSLTQLAVCSLVLSQRFHLTHVCSPRPPAAPFRVGTSPR